MTSERSHDGWRARDREGERGRLGEAAEAAAAAAEGQPWEAVKVDETKLHIEMVYRPRLHSTVHWESDARQEEKMRKGEN